MIQIGDRVRNISVGTYKEEPIVVIDKSLNFVSRYAKKASWRNRYHIQYLNVYTVQNTNVLSWVDEDDITLDIEYYRNEKLNKILGYEVA
jgi:hypothetical protein